MSARMPLSVDLSRLSGPSLLSLQRQLASVPALFRESASGGEIVVVDGSDLLWATQVQEAVLGGSAGVLLTAPGPCPASDLADAVRTVGAAGTPVVVPLRLVGNQAWAHSAEAVQRCAEQSVFLDSVNRWLPGAGESQPLFDSLVEQLALVGSVVGPVDSLQVRHRSASQFIINGMAGDVVVNLTATLTEAPDAGMQVELVGIQERWSFWLPDSCTARPGKITRYTTAGLESARPVFESSGRRAWIRLYDVVNGSASASPSSYALSFSVVADCVSRASRLLAPADVGNKLRRRR